MTNKPVSAKQHFSKDGRVPLTIEMTPQLKEKAKKRAKQLGMSFTEYGSRVLERAILQKQAEEAIKNRHERKTGLSKLLFGKIIANTNLGKQIEKRALENPTVDMATIVKEVFEENRKQKNSRYIYLR